MNVWPESLPQYPLIDGYSDLPQDSVLRSKMDGYTKQRNRFTANLYNVEESYLLTPAQFGVFENFYSSILGNGADTFIKKDAKTGIDRLYRFVGPYDMDYNGVQYRITVELERLP